MAMVTTQASVATFQPCVSKSRFLTGSSSKLTREFAVKTPTSSFKSYKVVAKKGEWLPGLASPGYLNGSLPGDNGFDPLGLAEDPENLRWYVQAELVNGRWAMLGVVGMLLPEVFTKLGIINAPQWYDAGKAEYFASSSTLFVIEFILFHYVEIRRWQDIKNPGCVNQDPIFKNYSLAPHELGYPGGPYLSVMSVTTVGYGDRAFKTLPGRLFASIWLLFSTLAVARAFLYLAEARIDKRHRRITKWVLDRDLTVEDLLAADVNNNGFIRYWLARFAA